MKENKIIDLFNKENMQIGFSDEFSYGDTEIKYVITRDNTVQLYVEDCARALGVTETKKTTGNTTVRWNRVYDDLVGIEKIANLGEFKNLSKDMKKHIRNELKQMTISESELYLWSFRVDSEQGKKFRDWLAKIVLPNLREHGIYVTGMENMTPEQVKRVTDERIESYVLRKFGINVRKSLTDTIKNVIDPLPSESWKYGMYTNIVYEVLFGMECKEYKLSLGLDEKENLRDYLSVNNRDEDISNIAKAEEFMGSLIMSGIIEKNMLVNLISNWYKRLIA
ncbi:BRO family protein [Clostridium sp. VAP51]|uniref:BRO family protein n=1 Tax=Clostridium sp. VAP51 TaxID=2949978 RepID=UPI0020797706|nr:BRO family protein [Clostridium sp. VAP51]